MDLAYDHVQEAVIEAGDPKRGNSTSADGSAGSGEGGANNLNAEFNEAYKAFSNSPWGMKFGGWLGEVKKQGESYYSSTAAAAARANVAGVAEAARGGLEGLKEGLKGRVRGLSLTGGSGTAAREEKGKGKGKMSEGEGERGLEEEGGEGFLETLKKNAAKRIEEIEKAEAKADEYLLKWGGTIGNFLKEAVTIAPPEGGEFADEAAGQGGDGADVLFDQGAGVAGEEGGKRQIYTTRLDAQLHLLHTSHDLFRTDPAVDSFQNTWTASFSAEQRTEQIAQDLASYPELRATMEKLVPGEVKYEEFWRRYYFLRTELDAEEQKRKELLKGALEEEEVGWDSGEEEEVVGEEEEAEEGEEEEGEGEVEEEEAEEEEGEEEEEEEDVAEKTADKEALEVKRIPRNQASTETLQAAPPPAKPRTSADGQSAADSDTSYDIVSGAPSGAGSRSGGSPKGANKKVDDESDDEDWE